MQPMPFHKIINDPVYGFITIDDELINQLIAHPYYQRLRRIYQMAMAHLVYPGAVHTRLHHSLGAARRVRAFRHRDVARSGGRRRRRRRCRGCR